MKTSTNRILTTHVGSLIRPPQLLEFVAQRHQGKALDKAAYARVLKDSVAQIVREQAEHGVDVVSDGECGKMISWSQYVLERMSGFEKRPAASDPYAQGADRERFSEFYAELDARDARAGVAFQPVVTGPIEYTGQAELQADIDNFKAALKQTKVTEAFLPVAAPASVVPDRKNEYYRTDEECVEAISDAMAVEYKMIVDAGFLVQVDDARAAVTFDRMVPPKTFREYRKWVALYMEALNHALRGIPEEKIRYHVCWGSWPGPHTTDVPLKDIVDLILRVKAGAYVIEGANPRHEHEWVVFRETRLPDDKVIIPGVLDSTTNFIEHPELVAQRLVRYAEVVGKERVMAGSDCGFATFGRSQHIVEPEIAWAKLQSMAEGARLASAQLWR
jgi:5-methyltetrahydropteroyltriglutamate--homocysteine methyltransferase